MSPTTLEDLDVEALWELDEPPTCEYTEEDHKARCTVKAVINFNITCVGQSRLGCSDIYAQYLNLVQWTKVTKIPILCNKCNRPFFICWKVTPL